MRTECSRQRSVAFILYLDDVIQKVDEEERADDVDYRRRQRDRREALQHDDQKVDPRLYDDSTSATKSGPKQSKCTL